MNSRSVIVATTIAVWLILAGGLACSDERPAKTKHDGLGGSFMYSFGNRTLVFEIGTRNVEIVEVKDGQVQTQISGKISSRASEEVGRELMKFHSSEKPGMYLKPNKETSWTLSILKNGSTSNYSGNAYPAPIARCIKLLTIDEGIPDEIPSVDTVWEFRPGR